MAKVLSLQKLTGAGKATTSAATLRKVKKFAITMLAAATVAFGSLVGSPSASAMSCTTAKTVSTVYFTMAGVFAAKGDWFNASFYYAMGTGVLQGGCS